MNAVGIHIRKLRRNENMTQQTLADRLSVTRQAVSQWEMGNTQPDLDTLAAIAGVFGVDMMEVIYGEKRKEPSGVDPQRRKRYLTGLIVFGVIALIVGIVRNTLGPYIDEWTSRYYDVRPVVIF
jgi:transcriptional regulator with XRE-family HTH domain